MIDLRSDTVTLPTPAMKQAMMEAPLGDDVIDIDPTVELLQERTAKLLGKESALFVPSGTMANQIAIRVHCQPADELICEAGCHIHQYEQGGFAALSGVVARTVDGRFGVIELDQVRDLIRSDNEHYPRTRLLALENTHNRGGGKIYPFETVRALVNWAQSNNLRTHLDGARLMNAVVASGIAAREWAAGFDTVSLCFSKGLGAPIGSILVGNREAIKLARRHRKLFGGGMRQVGILAAACLYALEHHIQRLAEDHANAKLIADIIRLCPGLILEPDQVDTNIIIFRVDPSLGTATEFVKKLADHQVLALPFSSQHVRLVTHLQISAADARTAGELIEQIAKRT